MAKTSAARRARIAKLSESVGRDLAARTVLFHHHLAARLGLSVTDLKCLDLLRSAAAPLTATQVAELIGLTGGAVTGVADRLEAAGLVERVRDPLDRRRYELRPVSVRHAEIAELFAPLASAIAQVAARYDDHELDAITSFLGELGPILDEQTAVLRSGTPTASQASL